MFLCNIACLISDSTKTITLLVLDFYEVIVDSGFALCSLSYIFSPQDDADAHEKFMKINRAYEVLKG